MSLHDLTWDVDELIEAAITEAMMSSTSRTGTFNSRMFAMHLYRQGFGVVEVDREGRPKPLIIEIPGSSASAKGGPATTDEELRNRLLKILDEWDIEYEPSTIVVDQILTLLGPSERGEGGGGEDSKTP